jgi:hypothetical protein
MVTAMAFAGAADAAVTVNVEAAGVQATTMTPPTYVETFASYSSTTGSGNGTLALPTVTTTFGGSPITGTLTGFELGNSASYGGVGYFYGGAFGSEQYGVVHGDATLKLSSAVTYFGLWAAALDSNNTIELLNGTTSLGSFNLVNTIGGLSSAYYGNPNNQQDGGEKFAFVNFLSSTPFDTIEFHQTGGGFEFDNLTVGSPAAVPEPASWAMMIVGFGTVGAAMRRRKVSLTFA